MPIVQVSFNENQAYPTDIAAATNAGSASFSWGGLFGTIVLFLLILLVALWMIRRLNQSTLRSMNTPWARVLDRQALSNQHSLYLVEIAGKLQVLGGTDHNLVKIDEINDLDLAAEILDEIAHRPVEKAEGFLTDIAKRLFVKRHKTKDPFAEELEQLLKEVER